MECEFGVVKKVIFPSEKKVILIHSPAFHETATILQELYEADGYEVIRLNTGVGEEAEEAENYIEKIEKYCMGEN